MKRKNLSIFLCIVFLLCAFYTPASAVTLTETQFLEKLNEVKALYPEGSQKYEWSVNGSVVGWQCHGYVRWLSHYVWGVDFANGKGTGWTLYYATPETTPIDRIVPGDVFRYRTSLTRESNHTMFITGVEGDTVYFTDCNSDSANTIKWERSISKATLAEFLKRKLSGYDTCGYIGHYEANTLTPANTLRLNYNASDGIIDDGGKKIMRYTVTSTNGINLRSGAGTNNSVLVAMPKNTVFEVTETAVAGGYTWGKTTYNGKTGWCVVSESWTVGEEISAALYYLNSDGMIYTSSTAQPYSQLMVRNIEYINGFANAADFDLKRDGYTFLGWSNVKNGDVVYTAGTTVKPESIFPELNNGSLQKTLYAVWQKNVVLEKIEISALPSKKRYLINSSFNSSGLKIKLIFSDKTEQILTEGFTLTGFDSSTVGTKSITVSYEEKTATFNVDIVNPKTGDVNKDSNIDLLDVTLCAQYLADWDVECDISAIDVNGDGDINLLDIVHLAQYIAEWDGVILK